jgi:hypothetical protein
MNNWKMKVHYGTKKIKAKLMTRGEYNLLRGWQTPKDEDPKDEGYLVEYLDSPNKVHPDYDNYISWSPKDVFESAYKQSGFLTFGHAIEAMKEGHKVARKGWNGKGMYAVLMPGYPNGIKVNEATQKVHGLKEGATLVFRPYFQLYTAQKDVAMWSPSGSDALAEDWMIVE